MTDDEKIERYKALQMAIRVTVDRYKEQAKGPKIKSYGLLGIYDRGAADAYLTVANDLEKWLDEEHK